MGIKDRMAPFPDGVIEADWFIQKLYHFAWVIWQWLACDSWVCQLIPLKIIPVCMSNLITWLTTCGTTFPHSETRDGEWPHEFPAVRLGLNWLENQRDMSCACFPCNKVLLHQSVADQYLGLWHGRDSLVDQPACILLTSAHLLLCHGRDVHLTWVKSLLLRHWVQGVLGSSTKSEEDLESFWWQVVTA